MDIQVNTMAGEVIVKGKDGGAVDVREFFTGCGDTGDMIDGESRTYDDGCIATRRGGLVIWWTPAGAPPAG